MDKYDVFEVILAVASTISFLFAVDRTKIEKKKLLPFLIIFIFTIAFLLFINLLSIKLKLNDINGLWFIITLFLPEAGLLIITTILLHKKFNLIESITATLNAFLCFYMMFSIATAFQPFIENFREFTIVLYLVGTPLLFLYLRFIYRRLQTIIVEYMPQQLWIIALYTSAIIIEMIIYAGLIQLTDELMLQFSIFNVAILSVYFVSIYGFFVILNDYQKKNIQLLNLEANKKQLDAILNYAERQKENEAKLRIIKHDMRHVLNNISSLIQEGKLQEAIEVISSYNEIVESNKFFQYCKDPAINAVINYYKNKCEDNNIPFKASVHEFEKDLKIPLEDLSLIISNILDNAYNATIKAKKPSITFKFINNHGQLLLQVINSFEGPILYDSEHLPTSREHNHGTGSKSIRYYAKKNNIFVDYQINEDIFKITILF